MVLVFTTNTGMYKNQCGASDFVLIVYSGMKNMKKNGKIDHQLVSAVSIAFSRVHLVAKELQEFLS